CSNRRWRSSSRRSRAATFTSCSSGIGSASEEASWPSGVGLYRQRAVHGEVVGPPSLLRRNACGGEVEAGVEARGVEDVALALCEVRDRAIEGAAISEGPEGAPPSVRGVVAAETLAGAD